MDSRNLENGALAARTNLFDDFVLKGGILGFDFTGTGYCVADLFKRTQAFSLLNCLVNERAQSHLWIGFLKDGLKARVQSWNVLLWNTDPLEASPILFALLDRRFFIFVLVKSMHKQEIDLADFSHRQEVRERLRAILWLVKVNDYRFYLILGQRFVCRSYIKIVQKRQLKTCIKVGYLPFATTATW